MRSLESDAIADVTPDVRSPDEPSDPAASAAIASIVMGVVGCLSALGVRRLASPFTTGSWDTVSVLLAWIWPWAVLFGFIVIVLGLVGVTCATAAWRGGAAKPAWMLGLLLSATSVALSAHMLWRLFAR